MSIPVGPVDPGIPANYIVLEPNGNIPVAGTYTFEIDATHNGAPASKFFQVVVEDPRSPVSVVFVLDKSGSMNSVPAGSIGTVKRIDILRTAASLFIDKLAALDNSGDQAALTYFDTDADNPNPAFGQNLELITTNATNFTDEITSVRLDPGGFTALGEGLLAGKGKFSSAPVGNKQFIFLFTDGEQNVGRQVDEVTGDNADGESLNNGDGSIQIMTIGTGAAAGLGPAMLLQKIAEANSAGGIARYFLFQEEINNDSDIDAATGVVDFFDTVFESILSGGSPQTVGVATGIMPPEIPVKKDFEINANIDKLLFELITSGWEPDFTITKDGVPINETNANIKIVRGPNNGVQSILAVVDISESTTITSQGIWSMNIRSGAGGGQPFQAKAQVDDHRLDYTFEVNADNFRVEDDLHLNTEITYDGSPIEDATISAVVLVPGDAKGDLLARTNVKFDPSSGGDAASVGYQKLLALIDDNPGLIDSLQLKENVVSLTHTGNGKYEAVFSGANVPGAYQIFARISGTSATGGNYQRLVSRTAYLRFGEPDPEISNQTYTHLGGNSIQLIYTPMYSIGTRQLFVGPGFATGITVTGVDVSNVVTVDNGDGSYTIDMDVSNGNTNPDVEISISGVEVFEGKASDFDNQGSILDDFKDWLQNTFGISIWIFLLILILILLIIWIIKKIIK